MLNTRFKNYIAFRNTIDVRLFVVKSCFLRNNNTFSNTSNHNILVNKYAVSVNDTPTGTINGTGICVKSRFLRNDSTFSNTVNVRSINLLDTRFKNDSTFSNTRNQCRSIYCCCNNSYNTTFGGTRNIDDDRFVILQITRTNDNTFSNTNEVRSINLLNTGVKNNSTFNNTIDLSICYSQRLSEFIVFNLTFSDTSNNSTLVGKCALSINQASTRTNNNAGSCFVEYYIFCNDYTFSNTNEVRLFGYNRAFGDDNTFSSTRNLGVCYSQCLI